MNLQNDMLSEQHPASEEYAFRVDEVGPWYKQTVFHKVGGITGTCEVYQDSVSVELTGTGVLRTPLTEEEIAKRLRAFFEAKVGPLTATPIDSLWEKSFLSMRVPHDVHSNIFSPPTLKVGGKNIGFEDFFDVTGDVNTPFSKK